MQSLIFSQTSVYRLHRLANKVRSITGIRHKLSEDSALINLMRACSFSDNTQIKWQFAEFIESLTTDQVQNLIDHGIELGFRQAG